jgi:hypothetical protein
MRRERENFSFGVGIYILASATFFVIASIRVGDVIGLLGGLFFFAACVVFLLPYYGSKDS